MVNASQLIFKKQNSLSNRQTKLFSATLKDSFTIVIVTFAMFWPWFSEYLWNVIPSDILEKKNLRDVSSTA